MTSQTLVVPELLFWPLIIAGAAALAGLTYVLLERWEAFRDQVRQRALPLAGVLAALVLLGWLGWQYWHWMALSEKVAETEKKIQAQTEAVKTVAQVLGGAFLLLGIYFTLRRIRAMEEQVRVSQEQLKTAQDGQVTERFTKAIEQLGSDKMDVRLGGIYALERISWDSDKDYWTIMEVLTAFIRENAPWPPKPSQEDQEQPFAEAEKAAEGRKEEPGEGEETPELPIQHKLKPPTDIQAALTVLGRRARRFGPGEEDEKQPLDLRKTYLRGADLSGKDVHLEGANLRGANLESADLSYSHLEGAELRRACLKRTKLNDAHLEKASLWEADLERANLRGAYLEGAYLGEAYLNGADLTRAHLERAEFNDATYLERACLNEAHLQEAILTGTHLEGANLRGAHLQGAELNWAHLQGAYLWGAHLEGTELEGAYLEGADLRQATGLTREQLAVAIQDENTKLPDYLTEKTGEEPGEPSTPAGEGPEEPETPPREG